MKNYVSNELAENKDLKRKISDNQLILNGAGDGI